MDKMIKIINAKEHERRLISIRDMRPLQVARIATNSSRVGELVMRTASSAEFEGMLLPPKTDNDCWTGDLSYNTMLVELLPPDEIITLEISNE